MTAVTPTDRPKSVRNSCVIKVFGGVFMLSRCFLDCPVGVGVFVTGLSQISSFFSSTINYSVLLRITDEGWKPEMHIWSILFICSKFKMVYAEGTMMRAWSPLRKSRHIVPDALLVRVHRSRNELYTAVEGSSTRHDDHWVTLLPSKLFNYFRAQLDDICCAIDSVICRIPSEAYSWNDISPT